MLSEAKTSLIFEPGGIDEILRFTWNDNDRALQLLAMKVALHKMSR
jgi:hypothetical protein